MKKDKKTGGTDKRYVSSLEKKVAKLESEVKNLKAGRKQLKEDLQKERKKKRRASNRTEQRTGTISLEPVERYTYKGFLIFAALLCCIYGGQSLRQTVRTLEIFNHLLNGQLGRIPCYRTIETWVAKSGLAVLKGTAKSIKEAYALMKDPDFIRH